MSETPSLTSSPCGCVEDGNTIYACELHGDVLYVQTSLTHRGFCEECCDGPAMKRLIRDLGRIRVARAIEYMSETERKYAERILETVDG